MLELLLAAENDGHFILGNSKKPYLYAILATAAASMHETLALPGPNSAVAAAPHCTNIEAGFIQHSTPMNITFQQT